MISHQHYTIFSIICKVPFHKYDRDFHEAKKLPLYESYEEIS